MTDVGQCTVGLGQSCVPEGRLKLVSTPQRARTLLLRFWQFVHAMGTGVRFFAAPPLEDPLFDLTEDKEAVDEAGASMRYGGWFCISEDSWSTVVSLQKRRHYIYV